MYRLILIWFYYILNWFIAFSFITIYYHLQYLLLHHLLQVAIKEHLLLFIPFITNCVLHLLPFIPFIPFITGATWRYRLYLILPAPKISPTLLAVAWRWYYAACSSDFTTAHLRELLVLLPLHLQPSSPRPWQQQPTVSLLVAHAKPGPGLWLGQPRCAGLVAL